MEKRKGRRDKVKEKISEKKYYVLYTNKEGDLGVGLWGLSVEKIFKKNGGVEVWITTLNVV